MNARAIGPRPSAGHSAHAGTGCTHINSVFAVGASFSLCDGASEGRSTGRDAHPAERAREDEKLFGQRTGVAPRDVPSQVVRPVALRPSLSGSVVTAVPVCVSENVSRHAKPRGHIHCEHPPSWQTIEWRAGFGSGSCVRTRVVHATGRHATEPNSRCFWRLITPFGTRGCARRACNGQWRRVP